MKCEMCAWDGSPTALDLAITGPTRSETLANSRWRPLRRMPPSRPPTSTLHRLVPARGSASNLSLLKAQVLGSLSLPSFFVVLPARLLYVKGLQPHCCRTSCCRNCVLPFDPATADPYSPGGLCPRPQRPSRTSVLRMSLPSLPPMTSRLVSRTCQVQSII